MRAEDECIYLAKYRSKTLDYEKQNDSDIQMDIDRYGSNNTDRRGLRMGHTVTLIENLMDY